MTLPSDTQAASGHPVPQTVHVAIYEHRHGTDMRVFRDRDQALNWRSHLAQTWWDTEFRDDPSPDSEICEEYFARMQDRGDEFFSITACPVDADTLGTADPSRETSPSDTGVAP